MNPQAVLLLGAIVGLLLLAAVVTAARHAVPRRLALRSAARRPGETILVIAGSMLGTAIITGSLIVGDTLDSSIRAGAWTQLGPIDETVTAFGEEHVEVFREALDDLPEHADVDGIAYGLRASATAGARLDTDDATVNPSVLLLELDFDAARDFGGDREATGLGTTPTPARGEAALSEDLAEDLGVGAEDRVTIFAYGVRRQLEVSALLPRLGLAGYSTDFRSQSFNVFVAPGTTSGMLAEAPPELDASPPVALAFISNRGDVLEGADLTDSVTALVRERIRSIEGAEVVESKRQVLDSAEQVGGQFSELFLGIGSFAVIAGVLLLVNIFVMLAEERKGELGMMRAVGMRRSQLVRAFYVEGSLYALAASALGALLGIAVGAAIVRVAADIFAGGGEFSLELRFTVGVASVVGGLLIGLFIALVTAGLTSTRISRLNIIRAIRDLPEPPGEGGRLRGIVLGALATAVGGAMTVGAIAGNDPVGALAGPGILALGLAALLGRPLSRRGVTTVLGLAVVAWGIFGATLAPAVFADAEIGVFVVQGVLLTAGSVAVLAHNQELVGRIVRRVAGGARNLAARLGLAYPLARRFRTAMTLAMYALVVFTLVFISLLSHVFGGQVDTFTRQESGGYDLLVRSSPANPLPPEAVEVVSGVSAVAPIRHAAFSVEFRPERLEEYEFWALAGFGASFIAGGPPELEAWLPAYRDDRAVWRAVLEDPSLMIVDQFFLQEGGPQARPVVLGDSVEVRDPVTGTVVPRTVVAKMRGGYSFSGPFISEESILEVLGPRAAPTRLYVALEEGADSGAVAAELESEYIPNGVSADTFRAIVSDNQQANLQFFRLMQGYLALGLLVGISGLGVIMVRAVRERRREIGVLRSLGFQSRTVGRSFLLESGFVALEGIAVGASLAIATAYQLINNAEVFGGLDVEFIVPWSEIVVLLSLALVGSLVATWWPARQASRIRPAVALRITD